jgi:hypothetical protein
MEGWRPGDDSHRRIQSAMPLKRLLWPALYAGESEGSSRGSLRMEMITVAQYAPLENGLDLVTKVLFHGMRELESKGKGN